MLDQNREHEIILNFGPDTHRDHAMQVHALHLDCKTVLSHWQAVESVETLRKMMRYLGVTDEQMMSDVVRGQPTPLGPRLGAYALAARPAQLAAHRLSPRSGQDRLRVVHSDHTYLKCLQSLKQCHGLERLSQQFKVVSTQMCTCQQVPCRNGGGE